MDIDYTIIFKIAAIGISIGLLNQLLIKSGKEEQAMLATIAGVVIVLIIIVQMITKLFQSVQVFLEF